MKKKYIVLTIILVTFSLLLVACNDTNTQEDKEVKEVKVELEKLKKENKELLKELENANTPNNSNQSNQEESLICKSLDLMQVIKDKGYEDLSSYIHPSKGVRFSPYFFVDMQNDQVLTAQEVADLNQNNSVLNWGTFDGSGDSIDFNFNDYYDRFIFDHDYTNPHMIAINTPIGIGNMIDNVADEYPNGQYVEFHFTGFDSQYEGMDWRSLRLVFEEDGGTWYLVGVVHGEWTI